MLHKMHLCKPAQLLTAHQVLARSCFYIDTDHSNDAQTAVTRVNVQAHRFNVTQPAHHLSQTEIP